VNGEAYDLLLTDINMEEFDGLDLISMIREEEQCNSLKIIVISSEAELIDIAHKLGANDYLVKPVESKDLKNSIDKVFSHQNLAKSS
jgi:two-component system response regulator YesN